jgi:T5orf172 domain
MELDGNGGWIYVVMTSSDYERFKVGRTNGNPITRAKQLRTGDPKLGLLVAYFVPASRGELFKVEASIHQLLDQRILFHDETNSEWFLGDAQEASKWIEHFFEFWMGQPVASMDKLGQGHICRAYEEDLRLFYGPRSPLNPIDGLPM